LLRRIRQQPGTAFDAKAVKGYSRQKKKRRKEKKRKEKKRGKKEMEEKKAKKRQKSVAPEGNSLLAGQDLWPGSS